MPTFRPLLTLLLAVLVATQPMLGLVADQWAPFLAECCGCCDNSETNGCCGEEGEGETPACPCDFAPVPDRDSPARASAPEIFAAPPWRLTTRLVFLPPTTKAAPTPTPRDLGPPRHLLFEVFLL